MASSTTKPVEMVSAISDKLSRLKPSKYITAKVPTSDSGTDRLGDDRRRQVAQEQEDHRQRIQEPQQETARNSTSLTDARMVVVRSVRHRDINGSRQR